MHIFWLFVGLALVNSFTPKTLEDSLGRGVIYHGVNVAYKIPPYLPSNTTFSPETSLTNLDIEYLKSWGFNIVRLGIFWEATETSLRQYNLTYLGEVNKVINALGQAGIFTVLDSHQDLFSRRLCGEGMPIFYTPQLKHRCDEYWIGAVFEIYGICKSMLSYNFTYDSNGDPLLSECMQHSFEIYYMSPEVSSIFYDFYNNQTLLLAYQNYWGQVAKVLGQNPYILAYDLLNEPWPGGFYEFPDYLVPGKTDLDYLQPFYFNLSNVIRKYSTGPYFAIEPTQLPDTFSKIVLPVGFTSTPTHSFLNDHSYCCEIGPEICANGEPSLINAMTVCKEFHKHKAEVRSLDAERLGIPLFFTEFGACSGSEACVQEILSSVEAFDSKALSWSYWQYKGFNDITTTGSSTEGFFFANGTLQDGKVKALSRTYFQYIQGKPLSIVFNDGAFVGTFFMNSTIRYPTEVYLNNQLYYPDGFEVIVSREGAKIWLGDNRVYIMFDFGYGDTQINITPVNNTQTSS